MFQKIKKVFFSGSFLIVLSLLLCAGLIGGAFAYKTNKANALGLTHVFSGRINMITICCNGLNVIIGSKNYIFTVGSRLYLWYNLTPGQCVMGDALPVGVCLSPIAWPPCSIPIPATGGTINMVGTTLTGPKSGMCGGISGGGGSGISGGDTGGDNGGGIDESGSSGGDDLGGAPAGSNPVGVGKNGENTLPEIE